MVTNTASYVPAEPVAKREPARLVGAIVALFAAVFVVFPLVGVRVDPDLPSAVETVVYAAGAVAAIAVPLVQAELTRRRVYAPATVDQVVAQTKADASVSRIDNRPHPRTVYDPDGDGRVNL